MIVSKNCVNLIKKYEGCKLESYLCPASIPTIGFGSTMWPDGKKVKLGEKINLEKAEKLLEWELKNKSIVLHGLNINQNQADSILCFVYNIGIGNFNKSTLLKKIKANPDDPTIRDEFMKWTKSTIKGVLTILPGLVERRKAEADLYFKI